VKKKKEKKNLKRERGRGKNLIAKKELRNPQGIRSGKKWEKTKGGEKKKKKRVKKKNIDQEGNRQSRGIKTKKKKTLRHP